MFYENDNNNNRLNYLGQEFNSFAENSFERIRKIPFDSTITPLSWVILVLSFVFCLVLY